MNGIARASIKVAGWPRPADDVLQPAMMLHRLLHESEIDKDCSRLALYSVDAPSGSEFAEHCHDRDQLVFATAGTMRVQVPEAVWLVMPQHAVLVPAGTLHAIGMIGDVAMRTLYAAPGLLGAHSRCRVMLVGPLLRALIDAKHGQATNATRAAALACLIVDEVGAAPDAGLRLPLPRDPRLVRLCARLQANPSDPATLLQWAEQIGSSERTLARLFAEECGMGFRAWRSRLRLERGIMQMDGGTKIEAAARAVGYRSRSAFSQALAGVLAEPAAPASQRLRKRSKETI